MIRLDKSVQNNHNMTLEFSDTSGRRPFAPIINSPHQAVIDEKLFSQRQPVLKVHKWLVDTFNIDTISYQMLNRYKKSRALATGRAPNDARRREVRRDLKYLGEVIKRAKAALEEGLFIRPADAIQAIQLRARLLEAFPDLSDEREEMFKATLQRTTEAVLKVVTDEQRLKIMALLQDGNETPGPDVE